MTVCIAATASNIAYKGTAISHIVAKTVHEVSVTALIVTTTAHRQTMTAHIAAAITRASVIAIHKDAISSHAHPFEPTVTTHEKGEVFNLLLFLFLLMFLLLLMLLFTFQFYGANEKIRRVIKDSTK